MRKNLTTIAIKPEAERRLERYASGASHHEPINRPLEQTPPRRPLLELGEMRKVSTSRSKRFSKSLG